MSSATILSYWNDLSRTIKLTAAGSLAVLVVAIAIFSSMRDSQALLFPRAQLPDQLSDIETHLAAWNVPFTADADNVRVPAKLRNDLLLRLSLAGVPRPHIADSNETLSKVGALTPQSVLDEQSRNGLAGDISLGLRGISGVADATVIIAPASAGYFADQASHDASASVRLALDPGVSLSPETVNGIKTYVAAAVAGLSPERVAVVDDRGVALSGRASSGDGDAQALQSSIQSALDQVLGAGRAIVRAHVDVDGRTNVQLETKRTPALAQPIAHQSVDEHYQNGKKQYSKVESSADGGSDVVQSETESAAGTLRRVSIAVFLDQSLADQIPHIRALVETAAGIDYGRGDTVTVQPIALAASASQPADAAPRGSPWRMLLASYLPLLPPAIVILAVLGLLLVLAKPIARTVATIVPPAAPRAPAPAFVSAVEQGLPPEAIHRALCGEPPHTAATVIATLPTPTAAAVLDLYPNDVRREIIGRLSRPRSPLGMDVAGDLAGSVRA